MPKALLEAPLYGTTQKAHKTLYYEAIQALLSTRNPTQTIAQIPSKQAIKFKIFGKFEKT